MDVGLARGWQSHVTLGTAALQGPEVVLHIALYATVKAVHDMQ